MNIISKIVLGTVQFGLDYGINNKNGKIKSDEVFRILDFAKANKIEYLDTSYLYGESEEVIGNFIKITNTKFKIISKLPSIDIDINKYFYETLKRLNQNKIYGYLIHHFDFFKNNPNLWDLLKIIKKNNKVSKIGFSIYHTYELDYIYQLGIKPDIIQFPYSIFDQRFESYLKKLKNDKVEIHVRSIFLQGLFFIKPENLNNKFEKIRDKLIKLNRLADENYFSLSELAMLFVMKNPYIDKVIIGVDSLDNLKENISLKKNMCDKLYLELKQLREDDTDIILPFNWNKI